MNGTIRFHHVGVVVSDIDRASAELVALGYALCGTRCADADQGLDFMMMTDPTHGAPALELIQPHRATSVVSGLLARDGPTPYHMCFEVEDIHAAARDRIDRGYSWVAEPTTSPLFEARLACFLYHEHLGLVELLERGADAAAG